MNSSMNHKPNMKNRNCTLLAFALVLAVTAIQTRDQSNYTPYAFFYQKTECKARRKFSGLGIEISSFLISLATL